MLLVNHGKRCPRCAKNGKPRKASDGDCPLFGSKSVQEILQEDAVNAHDLQPKQKAEVGKKLLVKQEGPDQEWDSSAKQEPDADHHAVVKLDADSEAYATAAVKSEPGP